MKNSSVDSIRSLRFAIVALILCVCGLRLLRPVLMRIDSPFDLGCSNQILMSVRNPTGDYTAALVERNCGATTDFVRSVYLAPGAHAPISDDPVAVANGIGISTVQWKDNNTLEIYCDPKTTRFSLQKATVGTFSVRYVSNVPVYDKK